MYHSISMTQFAASIACAAGVEKPDQAEEASKVVHEVVNSYFEYADRILIYNPDAIGMWLFQKYTEDFIPVIKNIQLSIPVKTVMPSVTPVCFGTMYTGTVPEIHGIMKYEKRKIATDSLFDAFERAGKKVAIVAVEQSSMAIIFQGRNIDYYILPDDKSVSDKAIELIREDKYNLIVVYNQEYDDMMHATGVESDESIQAMHHHISTFDALAGTVKAEWGAHNSMIVWATDHGIHQMENGHGNHGEDIEEDMNVMHFIGLYPASDSRKE